MNCGRFERQNGRFPLKNRRSKLSSDQSATQIAENGLFIHFGTMYIAHFRSVKNESIHVQCHMLASSQWGCR